MPHRVWTTVIPARELALALTLFDPLSERLIEPRMDYLSLKHLHMGFAGLSGGFFLLRGAWMLADSPLLRTRWVRTLPHVIDTILLSSAVALAIWSSQYPFSQGWLTAKVLALLAYIALGTIALKRGSTKTIRTMAYVAAVLVFIYIAGVARSKNPMFLLHG